MHRRSVQLGGGPGRGRPAALTSRSESWSSIGICFQLTSCGVHLGARTAREQHSSPGPTASALVASHHHDHRMIAHPMVHHQASARVSGPGHRPGSSARALQALTFR